MTPGGAGSGVALVPVVVLVAAILHAVWNALAHAMTDQLVGFALINVAATACSVVAVCLVPPPSASVWPFLLGSTAAHVLYQLLLLKSYGLGDFAQMYPIARGTSPLLVAVYAIVVLGQPITAGELVGVLVISVGLIGLTLSGGLPGRAQWPALAAALATGTMIASYTVIDGLGVRRSISVPSYLAWLFLLQGPLLVGLAFATRGRAVLARLGVRVWLLGLGGGVISLVAYGLVIWAQAQGRGNLATVAALRETSIVIAAVVGAVFFHERFGRSRVIASAVVVTGIALLEFAPH